MPARPAACSMAAIWAAVTTFIALIHGLQVNGLSGGLRRKPLPRLPGAGRCRGFPVVSLSVDSRPGCLAGCLVGVRLASLALPAPLFSISLMAFPRSNIFSLRSLPLKGLLGGASPKTSAATSGGQRDAAAFQQFLYPLILVMDALLKSVLRSFLYQLRFFRFPDGLSALKHFSPCAHCRLGVSWGRIAENFCVDFRGQGDAAAFQ